MVQAVGRGSSRHLKSARQGMQRIEPVEFMRTMVSTSMPCVLVAALFGLGSPTHSRDRPFDGDWRFLRGDAPDAEKPDFSDFDWHAIHVPQDWSIKDIPLLRARSR